MRRRRDGTGHDRGAARVAIAAAALGGLLLAAPPAPARDVVVSARGDRAWAQDGRVWLQPAGQRRRVVGRGRRGIAFENARTLRWRGQFGGPVRFHDFRPLPQRGGCPARPRARVVIRTPDLQVTEAYYGFGDFPPDDTRHVFRTCVRDGTDRIVAQGMTYYGADRMFAAVGVDRGWVVLRQIMGTKYQCPSGLVVAIDAASGRRARELPFPACGIEWPAPELGDPIAVTEGGVPAWIVRDGDEDVLLSGFAELDRGSLTDLRAAGGSVFWSSAGVPRSTPLD